MNSLINDLLALRRLLAINEEQLTRCVSFCQTIPGGVALPQIVGVSGDPNS